MFDVPGFDPSSMSDDELMTRQAELSRRLVWASRWSGSGDMTSQFQMMLMAVEGERRDRMLKLMFAERQKMFPEIIETEPDLKVKAPVAKDDDRDKRMINRRKVGRERLTLVKTAHPTSVQPHFPQSEPEDDSAPKKED
jgi:hypothetical protein